VVIDDLKAKNLLNIRGLWIINICLKGKGIVDGDEYEFSNQEALYVGQGKRTEI
jgi:5-keto 4-deoxyuronate isomerase